MAELNATLKNRVTVDENGIIYQDGVPLARKTDPSYCTCSDCGTTYILTFKSRQKRINRNKEKGRPYPDFNLCKNCSMKPNFKDTMRKTYGTESALENPLLLQKQQNTMVERFGTHAAMLNDELKKKQQQSTFDHLGVPVSSKHPQTVSKMIDTNKERYGLPFTSIVPEIRNKMIESRIKNGNGTDPFSAKNKYGSTFERKVYTYILKYLIDNHINLKIHKNYRFRNFYFDIALINPDGSINLFIECDGYFYHGYKYGYDFNFNNSTEPFGFSSKRNADEKRLLSSSGYKIFIVKENEDLSINEDDLEQVKQNLFISYNEWLMNEMVKYFHYNYYMHTQNSQEIYINYINSIRKDPKNNGFSPLDFSNKNIEQDDTYIYQKTIGISPFDLKEDKDFY